MGNTVFYGMIAALAGTVAYMIHSLYADIASSLESVNTVISGLPL